MGAGSSCNGTMYKDPNEGETDSFNTSNSPHIDKAQSQWKLMETSTMARRKFEADGTLQKGSDPEHLELRAMLEEPLAQQYLGKYARANKSLDIFMCWVDIQEYKSIPTEDYRRSKALHIFHKYIKTGSVLEVGVVVEADRIQFKEKLEQSKTNKAILIPGFYDQIQSKCFQTIYHNIFLPFKTTEEFNILLTELKRSYNHVNVDDFEYFSKLGEGGFGLVLHCKKKSTGKHYAMKIQTKRGLLDCFADDPWRADLERQAVVTCQHPFIVNLDYSFQTDALAIMVLGLATGGDLLSNLEAMPDECLPEERVRFYMAEVVLALGYLHQLGLMYRDLKPNNILLTELGHVQLVDLGGVVDAGGKTLKMSNDQSLSHLFSTASASTNAKPRPASNVPTLSSTPEYEETSGPAIEEGFQHKRRTSIMGTYGYMAPEMLVMMSQNISNQTGYSLSVDWWSMGVTIFKLLTGQRPFTMDDFKAFINMATTTYYKHGDASIPLGNRVNHEYMSFFYEIPFPRSMSPEAVDIISRFLDVNENNRLGSGPTGLADIKSHPFFRTIDWDLLEQRHIEAPYKPPVISNPNLIPAPNFEFLMQSLGKEKWLTEKLPTKDEQIYFKNWDFLSPNTIRVEFGLSNVMEQYDKSFKVRQIMGSKDMGDTGAVRKTIVSTPKRPSNPIPTSSP